MTTFGSFMGRVTGIAAAIATGEYNGVLSTLKSTSETSIISRPSTTRYSIFQDRSDGVYLNYNLDTKPYTPGGYSLFQLADAIFGSFGLSLNQDNAAVVHTGTWTDTTFGTPFGGNYKWSTTTNDKAVFTTPANSRAAGFHTILTDNAGLLLVTVNGDTTRANLLNTAQDIVDSGDFPNTILVGNGGTLNPTDRVYDQYAAATVWDTLIGAADGLTAGVHTVQLDVTGYKIAASSDNRLYSSGYIYSDTATDIDTASVNFYSGPLGEVLTVDSAYEYAYKVDISGEVFVGNIHGYDVPVSFAFTVDGTPTTLLVGENASGSSIVINRVSNLRHPNEGAGATNIADVDLTYTFNSSGINIESTVEWLVSATLSTSYNAMFPVLDYINTGKLINFPTRYTLDADDDSFVGKEQTTAEYCYSDNVIAGLFTVDTLTTTNSWANSAPTNLAIEDRVLLSKMYLALVTDTNTLPVVNGTTQVSKYILAAAKFLSTTGKV